MLHRALFRLPAGQAPKSSRWPTTPGSSSSGDWGTGEGLAIQVADRMREAITDAGERQVHVVHLGDVYYAGTRIEARTRFLDHWPVSGSDRHLSWCLNGNHDMLLRR